MVSAAQADAQSAVEENKKRTLAAIEAMTVTNDFTQDDLDGLVLDACTYKINAYASPSVSTDDFKLTYATADAVSSMEAKVTIAINDGSVTFSVKKEIPKLSAVGNTENQPTPKPTSTATPKPAVTATPNAQSATLSPKEDMAAMSSAFHAGRTSGRYGYTGK